MATLAAMAIEPHESGTVERVRLLGGASCRERSVLVVVRLRDLDEPDLRVLEMAEHAIEGIRETGCGLDRGRE